MTMVSTPSRRRRDRRAVERLHRAFVLLLVVVSSRSLARPVAADEYSATVERAISRSGGLQAIGAVDGLLEHLRVSLCEGDEAGCALYETARKDLWLSLGRDAICGAGEDEEATWTAVDRTNTQGGFAVLLSLCSSPWLGDLEAEVVDLASSFLARASLTREDVKRVIEANDAAAERRATTASDDLTTLHPSYVPELAPVATEIDALSGFGYDRPVVVTAVAPSDEAARGFNGDVQGKVDDARAAGARRRGGGMLSRQNVFRLFSNLLSSGAAKGPTAEEEIRALKEALREAHDRVETLSEDKRLAEKNARQMDSERAALASEQVAVQKTVSELGRELLETAKESWSIRSELAIKDAEIERLRKNKGEAKSSKVDAKPSNVEDAREFIFNYFATKRCDSVGMDELMRVKPSALSDMDLFAALAERITDTAYQTASHMVVVHQI